MHLLRQMQINFLIAFSFLQNAKTVQYYSIFAFLACIPNSNIDSPITKYLRSIDIKNRFQKCWPLPKNSALLWLRIASCYAKKTHQTEKKSQFFRQN